MGKTRACGMLVLLAVGCSGAPSGVLAEVDAGDPRMLAATVPGDAAPDVARIAVAVDDAGSDPPVDAAPVHASDGETSADAPAPVEASIPCELPDYRCPAPLECVVPPDATAVCLGSQPPGPSCTPASCPGCCDLNDTCQAGASNVVCGSRGVACANCSMMSELCVGGTCGAP